MLFLDCLYFLFIEPLQLLFEAIFYYAYKFTDNPGISIVVISLVINFLVLPLYRRADRLEKEQADKKLRMKPWVDHIKATFKGDERVMILQAYYRENDYGITSVLKESVSLFLQIPFFIAAYRFLSGLKLLQGVPLGPITDLGAPDALIGIGSLSINALPVLMTLINIVSGLVYSRKGSIKDKIKLIVIALVFLVLLYGSPAGLVFYWTLNNLFSLGKNIVASLVKPRQETKAVNEGNKENRGGFTVTVLAGAVLAVLTGVMIPSDIIVQNPTEMTNLFSTDPHSPLLYILSSALIAVGTYMLWVPLFAYLSKEKVKRFASCFLPAAAVIGVVNYIAFNKNFGTLSNKLIYEGTVEFGAKEIIINLIADIAVGAVMVFISMKWKKVIKWVTVIALIAVLMLSVMRMVAIIAFVSGFNYNYRNTADDVSVPMTTSGQNVVVIMMDKMNGSYVPYIFNERPDVAEQFDGFTYYPNTVSLGKYTNSGTPCLFGGYDYSPDKMNARSDELLVDKHNEALLTMPLIFRDNGWKVTVGDPPYANYQWTPDLSIYDEYEGINAYHLSGVFNDDVPALANAGEELEIRLNRNLFCFGFMKSLPYALQSVAYCEGSYGYLNFGYSMTFGYTWHIQNGILESHVQEAAVLNSLDRVVDITDDPENCFFVMANGTTHEVSLLKEPDYAPDVYIDNIDYDATHMDRFTVGGVTMTMEGEGIFFLTYAAYESSMESCIALGQWFDYLRENGLYDNTRIIIVADHGFGMAQFDELLIDGMELDAESVNPVLLVKDFNSTGFNVSDEFMTTADTPSLALHGLVEDPVNPFTKNPIYQDIKSSGVFVYCSEENNIYFNNGTRFNPNGNWYTVHDNIYDDENWTQCQGEPT